MPWHDVQYLKITCRAGPFGGVTCGRVGRPPICPSSVAIDAHSTSAATAHEAARTRARGSITTPLHHLERLQPAGARPDLVLVNLVQVQNAQQHVGRALRVVGTHKMAVPLERPVDAADE